jgi:hypothetical protein
VSQHARESGQDRKGRLADAQRIKGDLRDLVATRFGMSGRTLDRWLQVLGLPLPLQQAADEGTLPLVLAVKVAALDKDAQAQIAAEIGGGRAARDVVARHLQRAGKDETPEASFARLLRELLRAGERLTPGRIRTLKAGAFGRGLEELRQGKELLTGLIAQRERNAQAADSAFQRFRGKRDEEE